jgi:hypothetical protein
MNNQPLHLQLLNVAQRIKARITFFATLIVLLNAIHLKSQAQNDEQLWLEVQTSYPFANRYLLENTATYQTLLSKEGKWRSFSISPTFEYTLFRKLDLLSEIPMGYTNQTDTTSTFEITPMVGMRYYITQNKRIDTRLVWRYQVRGFYNIEAADWDISNRTRLRAEVFVSLNGPNLFTDKLWYLFLDYEEFFVIDEQLDERYANRRRGRMGVGYRLNYKHRFELGYTKQSSRAELEGSFNRTDNVIQFKYKLFFNPASTTPASKDK